MPSHSPSASVDPLETLRGLKRRWRLVALIAVAVPLLAALALAHRKPAYRATGTLLYAPVDFSPSLLRSVVETTRVTDALMASQKAVIGSAPAVAALVKDLGLDTRKDFNPALARPSRLHRWLFGTRPPVNRAGQHRAALTAARQALSVSVPAGSQLIRVSFTARDPKLAASGANLAMRIYLDGQRNSALSTLEAAESWLQKRATATAASLGLTDVAIARARAASGTERGVHAPLTNQEASRLADQLVSAKSALAAAEARLGTGADGVSNAEVEAAASPSLAPLQAREAALASRLQSRAADEGPNYPGVAADRRALASIRAHIKAAAARLVASDRARVAADTARVATLESELRAVRDKASAESIRAAPIASLEQKQEAERSLLKALTEQIGTLESQSLLTRPDARIVSPAEIPQGPVAPPMMLVIGGAGLLGLCLGGLAALAAEAIDPRLRSGSEVRVSLGRPCLALIPEIGRRERGAASVADYARDNPFSPLNEQLRALRANLWLGAPPRSLAVPGARPGGGTATVGLRLPRRERPQATGDVVCLDEGQVDLSVRACQVKERLLTCHRGTPLCCFEGTRRGGWTRKSPALAGGASRGGPSRMVAAAPVRCRGIGPPLRGVGPGSPPP